MPLRGSRAAGPWGRRRLLLLPPPLLLLLALAACAARASEITFELPDNAKQCFYEEIAQGTKCTLEFQVAGRPGAASRGRAGPGPGPGPGPGVPRWRSCVPAQRRGEYLKNSCPRRCRESDFLVVYEALAP